MISLTKAQMARQLLIMRHIDKEISTKELAVNLNMTDRNARRITADYIKRGIQSLIHGNIGRNRETLVQKALRERIEDIYSNTMYDNKPLFKNNITYASFRDVLEYDYGIDVSKGYVRKIIKKLHCSSPKHHKNVAIIEHLFRPRKEFMGELIQIDGTFYDWFGDGKKYCIHLFVDDATSYPVAAYMKENECLLGYMEAFRIMAKRFGLPMALYGDRASVFFNNNAPNDGKEHLTQFGRMMKAVGTDLIPANSPEAKGRVERENQTLKERLPLYFRLHGITTMEKANNFFKSNGLYDIYRMWFPFDKEDHQMRRRNQKSKFCNKVSSHDKNEDTAVFVKAAPQAVESVLCMKYLHKTDNGGILSHMGYKFFCPTLPHRKVFVCFNEKDGIWATSVDSDVRHKVFLAEGDSDGRMPEVMKCLIARTLEKDAKAKYDEVYIDIDSPVFSHKPVKKKTA